MQCSTGSITPRTTYMTYVSRYFTFLNFLHPKPSQHDLAALDVDLVSNFSLRILLHSFEEIRWNGNLESKPLSSKPFPPFLSWFAQEFSTLSKMGRRWWRGRSFTTLSAPPPSALRATRPMSWSPTHSIPVT